MGRHTIFVVLALALAWMLLLEEISWQSMAVGLFISMMCMHFIGKYLRFEEIEKVNFFKLVTYPFWMVARIYMDAVFLTKLIFSGAKWGFIDHKLALENESLRIILSMSVTLTPGSIFIEREEKDITVLCIGARKKAGFPATLACLREVERILMNAQQK